MQKAAEEHLLVGLMSGTSMDGIDAALVRIGNAPPAVETIAHHHVPYSDQVRLGLAALVSGECSLAGLSRANVALGEMNAEAVAELLRSAEIVSTKVLAIGYHGQTIQHLPQPAEMFGRQVRSTLQIGDAAALAERTGITVVSNFRARDMAAGGEGAPLVPFFDYAVFAHSEIGRVALNIGGIANVTMIQSAAKPEQVTAFDTGPGNMLIDLYIRNMTAGKEHFDRDGLKAATGKPDSMLLKRLLAHPFISQAPPKSTGRETFGPDFLDDLPIKDLNQEDVLATLTEFTATSIVQAISRFWPGSGNPSQIIASGGGVHNHTLMKMLKGKLGGELKTSDEFGIPADFKEAVAFAWLADRTLRNLPGNLPSATGASHPAILGQITPAGRNGI